MRLTCTSNIASTLTSTPSSWWIVFARRSLLARLMARKRWRNSASSAAHFRRSRSSRSFSHAEPSFSVSSADRPGFACFSQRRTAMPLVTLVKRSGHSSAKSAKIVSRISRECSFATPLTRCAADHRQVRHAHAPVAFFVDQRHAAAAIQVVADSVALTIFEEVAIDLVDDLQVARQEPLEERDRPGLQRLGQQRVIGVAADLAA